LYEEDEREEIDENQTEISGDKNIKVGLKVSITEIPETVQCPAETEDVEESEVREEDEDEDQHEVLSEEENEKKDVEESNESKDAEGKEDESENSESIQENISADRSTDEEC
jgi:hypothetical protein